MNRYFYASEGSRRQEFRVTFMRLRRGDRLTVVLLCGAALWLLLAAMS